MEIIFHLGHYKTGTTSFQSSCHQNRDILEKEFATRYLGEFNSEVYGTPIHHAAIVNSIKIGQSESVLQHMSDELKIAKQLGCQTLLVSTETFASLSVELASKFFNEVRLLGCNVRAVFVVRQLDSAMRSWIKQLVAHGGVSFCISDFRTATRRYVSMIESCEAMFPNDITFVSFQKLVDSETFCKSLLDYCSSSFNSNSNLEFGANTSESYFRSPFTLLTSYWRGVIAASLGKPLYSDDVTTELGSCFSELKSLEDVNVMSIENQASIAAHFNEGFDRLWTDVINSLKEEFSDQYSHYSWFKLLGQ